MRRGFEFDMSTDELLDCAEEAFAAIESNTGTRHWSISDGIPKAVEVFNALFAEHGLAWLIDAATGSGMSHVGLMHWLGEAKKVAA